MSSPPPLHRLNRVKRNEMSSFYGTKKYSFQARSKPHLRGEYNATRGVRVRDSFLLSLPLPLKLPYKYVTYVIVTGKLLGCQHSVASKPHKNKHNVRSYTVLFSTPDWHLKRFSIKVVH